MTASVAQPTLAGSSSPGSDCGTAEVSCCPQMWLPTKLGITTIGTRTLWTCCWWRLTRTSRLHPTWFPRSSMRIYALQLRCTAGDAGQLGLGEFFDQWRRWLRCMGGREVLPAFIGFSLGLPGGDPEPGDKKEHAHIGRFVAGWRGRAQAHFSLGRPTLTAGILQGACAGRAAWECVV